MNQLTLKSKSMKTTATLFIKKQSRIMLLFIASIWLFGASSVLAQNNFTIPDAHFAAWLTANIPSAMSSGNLMDTTNVSITTRTRIDVENLGIADLSGIQYFTSLVTLDCGNGYGASNPNTLTSLPALPVTLDSLICGLNLITSLPALPASLTHLACYANHLSSLPVLPSTLDYLDCGSNQITALPTLPSVLTVLICDQNQLTSLPALLPSGLANLSCSGNVLTTIPALPASIYSFYCGANQLTSIPTLPSSLLYFDCTNNQITSLPTIPSSTHIVNCAYNQITSLPVLPNSVYELNCYNNQLTGLPALSGLTILDCSNNQITCFPVFPAITDTNNFHIDNNPFTCLPNYIPAMHAGILAFPLCLPGNTNGCTVSNGIIGFAYTDNNSNCLKDAGDLNLENVPMKIYDVNNNLLNQAYTAVNGVYDFSDSTSGAFKVMVDTTGAPFKMQCVNPGLDSTVVLTGLDTNVNFSLTCKAGFDVGVQSIQTIGLVFPGQQHEVNVVAGDMSHWYNLNCASGTSGTVAITVAGPVTYVGPASGALTPTVASNVYTYAIADFGTVNNSTAFNLLFKTDTSAQAGNLVCVSVVVTPGVDNNVSNNVHQYCYPVVNSHDPNVKEVYPVNVQPNYSGWFTYTIHFQNTGSAAAANIIVLDTLDSHLDLSTFQLINYSHHNIASLKGNVLSVRFPNIMLPDSMSNAMGSTGSFQYRIKPKANLPLGTSIANTGYIYFDFNSAVVTNTTMNMFTSTASVSELETSTAVVGVYPNPFSDNTTFVIQSEKMNEMYSFEMLDVLGKVVKSVNGISSKQFQVSRNGLETGIYFYKIYSAERVIGMGKVVIR
jgi:uncharacterized repeat protein (TIGR01451 family)